MVKCAKCKSDNPPEQRYCQKCHADLLPGEGFGTRLAYLVVAGLFTALGVFVLIRIINAKVPTEQECALLSPVFWGALVIITPILGLSYALRPTPPHRRFLNRAQRHTALDPEQALTDLNHALELAPEKERAGILKTRTGLYKKLGLQLQATRDQLAYTQADGAYQGGEMFANLTGIDSDTFVDGLRKGEQQSLLKSGQAVGLGYCSKCKDVVLLNEKLRCSKHTRKKIDELRLVVPEDVEKTRPELLESHIKKTRSLRNRRLFTLAASVIACGALYYVFEISPSRHATVETPVDQPVETQLSQEASGPQVFDEHGFQFQYPGDWDIIQESDKDTLYNTSLKGIDTNQVEYLGGVYHQGLNNCEGCAQVVIVVVKNPALTGTLTDEQFEAAKQANQETMGDRLLSYNKVSIDSLPATESKHIGRSRESQLWELIILPPEPGMAYLISMSSPPGDYADYEPHFQEVVDTLKIDTRAQ